MGGDNGFTNRGRGTAGRKNKIHSPLRIYSPAIRCIAVDSQRIGENQIFVDWHAEYNPEIIATEMPIFSKKGGYAEQLIVLRRLR